MTKDNVESDIKIIKNIYKSKGFQNILVTAKVERFSQDRVNLIYDIQEGKQQKINVIKFVGNTFFSNNYLNSIIKSQSIKFYNIFKSGSNLNYSTFEFDKNLIISKYRNDGYADIKVSYSLEKSNLNNNILYFYIEEGERLKINNLVYDFEDNSLNKSIKELSLQLEKELNKNNSYYNSYLIDEYLEIYNLELQSNNIYNKVIDVSVSNNNESIDIVFFDKKSTPVIINKIDITGNSITKNKTIRSKISFEPGEYLNDYKLKNLSKNLKRYPYIKDVLIETSVNDQIADININIDEETKTGNVLLAGTFNADTGAGLTLGIEDKNIFGSGNSLSSNFSANSEDLKFDINYVQYPLLNPNLTNTDTIFFQEYDYTNSFGYKASNRGVTILLILNKVKKSVMVQEQISKVSRDTYSNTSSSINDNIGNFQITD